MAERVVGNINRALHELFAAAPDVYLLGEDISDPYGGAFKVTRGLSGSYPDRVLSTPLSENAIVGVASGLALCGNRVIVELMFGDFLLLAMDQLVNFAAKSVSMYGHPVPLRLVIRCPVGGQRGYGATHSQSVQKFVVGVPDLELWEMSPFVDASRVLDRAFAGQRPAVFFEDKVLYGKSMLNDGRADGEWAFETGADQQLWTVIRPREEAGPDVLVIASGGTVHRALEAAAMVRRQSGLTAHLAVPARLYPCDPAPIAPVIARAGRVIIVEEGTPGGSWSGELAYRIHTSQWLDLAAPVELVSSRPSVIPAASHLEQQVLVSAAGIAERIGRLTGRTARPVRRQAGPSADLASAPDPTAAGVTPLVVPRLNANDDAVTLVEWLAPAGAAVTAGQPVAVIETSKAASEVEAPAAGILHPQAESGTDLPLGAVIALVCAPGSAAGPAGVAEASVRTEPDGAGGPAPAATSAGRRFRTMAAPPARQRHRRVQAGVAATVTASHRTIPPAFATVEAVVDDVLGFLREREAQSGARIDLGAYVVAAVGRLHSTHPAMFAPVKEGVAAARSRPDVAVTIDAGTGLFLPVIRDTDELALDEIADRLVELQMAAVAGTLGTEDLDTRGVGLAVSLNLVPGVISVQPIITPGMSCMVSVGGVRPLVTGAADGVPQVRRGVTLGIAHDHRVINGRPAVEFLAALAALFRDPRAVTAS